MLNADNSHREKTVKYAKLSSQRKRGAMSLENPTGNYVTQKHPVLLSSFRWNDRSFRALSASPTLQLPHDIILPEAISAWPLAYGWWLLISLCLISVAALLWFFWQRRRAQAPHRAALAQLNSFQRQTDDRRFLSDCAVWLKRQAIVFHNREQVAALNGDAWLKFLDETGNTQAFSQGPGRALLTLYQPKLALQRDALNALLQSWLNQQYEAQRKGKNHRV